MSRSWPMPDQDNKRGQMRQLVWPAYRCKFHVYRILEIKEFQDEIIFLKIVLDSYLRS